MPENIECEFHTLGTLDYYNQTVSCDECGHTEQADPDDIAEQTRLLNELDKDK